MRLPQKTYFILFVVFAAFSVLSQIAYTSNIGLLNTAAYPFRAAFPYKWGFFSLAKPYNYRIEIHWFNQQNEKIHSEEISRGVTERHMNSFISGKAFLDFELLSHACLTYHYADYLREQHSEEIKTYAEQLNNIQKAMVRYIDLNHYQYNAYSFDYSVYISDITKPGYKEKIYQSGPILNEAKYGRYR